MYKEKHNLKGTTHWNVEKLAQCYKKENARLRCKAYAAEYKCLYLVKHGKKAGTWETPAPLKKPLGDSFEYQSFCTDLRLEPVFFPLCEKLPIGTKQPDGIITIAQYLYEKRIPTPPVKKRRAAFRTMFCLPPGKDEDWSCGFQFVARMMINRLCYDQDHATVRYTSNGSCLPDWTDEEDKDFERRENIYRGLKDWYYFYKKKTLVDKICAELNKLYNDEKDLRELVGPKDEVQPAEPCGLMGSTSD